MPDNCEELQKVCHTRIKKQTQTASIAYDLRHCCLGIRINKSKNNQIESFTDKKIHNFLQRNNISKSSPEKDLSGKDIGTEWFKISSQKAINFLNQYKGGNEILSNKNKIKIKFRPEQKEAIQKTAECYIDSINKNKEEGKMLWDAIMRFGKTLCTYAFIDKVNREYGNIIKKVLILTHRPDVNKGWFEEFQNYFINFKKLSNQYTYYSKHKEYGENWDNSINQIKNFFFFISIQDLRGKECEDDEKITQEEIKKI